MLLPESFIQGLSLDAAVRKDDEAQPALEPLVDLGHQLLYLLGPLHCMHAVHDESGAGPVSDAHDDGSVQEGTSPLVQALN